MKTSSGLTEKQMKTPKPRRARAQRTDALCPLKSRTLARSVDDRIAVLELNDHASGPPIDDRSWSYISYRNKMQANNAVKITFAQVFEDSVAIRPVGLKLLEISCPDVDASQSQW